MAVLSLSLRKKLRAYPAEALKQIADAWAVEITAEEDQTSSPLEEQLQDMIAARSAWESLSLPARELLHQMIACEVTDGIPREDLRKLAHLSDIECATALRELEQRLMLIEGKPDARVRVRLENSGQSVTHVLLIPKDFREMFTTIDSEITGERGDRSRLHMTELLQAYDPQKLLAIARILDTSSGSNYYSYHYYPTHSLTLAKTIAGKLVQARLLEWIWEKLDVVDQKICRQLCRMDGSEEISQLRADLSLSRQELDRHLRQLENYALVFDTFSGQERKVFVGIGVFKVLRQVIGEMDNLEALPVSSDRVFLAEAPPIVREAPEQLLNDLAVVVGAVYQQTIEPTQAGHVPKRIANKIFPLLHGSRPSSYEDEDRYLDMIFATALALGLIQLTQQSGQKPRYLAGSNLDDWMKLEPSQQVRLFLDLWWKPTNNFWIDVAGANYQPEGFGYYMDIRAARKGILDYLKQECEPGTWYVLEAFLQNAKAHDPLLLRSQSPYAAYSGLRNRKDILARWDLTDGQIITGILASTLHELGLVTIGFHPAASINEEAGNPYAFQLTSLAKEVLWPDVQGITGKIDKPEHPLIVQPNFELLLLQPDYIALYQILPFARAEQVEMVSRLLLTQDSVRHGIEAGWNIDRILQTLRSLSSKELPQNVLYTLQDWGRLFKDASISQVLLIEVGNETVADDLCSSTKFRSLGLRRLGPCAVAVSNQASFQTLRNTLEKEGIIVRVQGDILSARDNASTSYGRRR